MTRNPLSVYMGFWQERLALRTLRRGGVSAQPAELGGAELARLPRLAALVLHRVRTPHGCTSPQFLNFDTLNLLYSPVVMHYKTACLTRAPHVGGQCGAWGGIVQPAWLFPGTSWWHQQSLWNLISMLRPAEQSSLITWTCCCCMFRLGLQCLTSAGPVR